MSKKYAKNGKILNDYYEQELAKLQGELVKLQYWIKNQGLRVIVIFEGRDAAGKGGAIRRIMRRLNTRMVNLVALDKPSDQEQRQWYFQRYIDHLPAEGEMVLFDRSWYNRAGVEWVMGFCTEKEYRHFLNECPIFERMLVRDGIILIKYWFEISDKEQEKRFRSRNHDPRKLWKLSPMDMESRAKWDEYSKARDAMFAYTDINEAPWYIVQANSKKHARLNCIAHLLNMVPYQDLTPEPVKFKKRKNTDYKPLTAEGHNLVPLVYGSKYDKN
ncbi:MAG: polyphosphate kinase 2 [Anaerolinea sp. 4484_236]|nr:MAG: polyphosphate kinase 2 [Anaerolinea sp. 4484_236]OQY30582.1 MAG: polyphosphate kinase 2 [Anaerolineaceae bacterium 4572_5.2]RLD04897.1 MAG: polyphosphate kinase 2 [Chloroflexota bacterium]